MRKIEEMMKREQPAVRDCARTSLSIPVWSWEYRVKCQHCIKSRLKIACMHKFAKLI